MDFKVDDKIRRPKGKMVYRVLAIECTNRFGHLFVMNVGTNKKYYFSKEVSDRFLIYDAITPKMVSDDIKYSFKHG